MTGVNQGVQGCSLSRHSATVADVPDTRESAEPITATVAANVRKWRERAGMSQAGLAAAMTALGVPWKRATVVNLEKRGAGSRGDAATGRDALTVGELLALASALDVPPVLLLADPRTDTVVSVGPGREMPPKAALGWLIGAAEVGPEHAEFTAAWFRARQALEDWKSLRRLGLRTAGMRETEQELRDRYVKAADELGRFLPDPHDHGAAFTGEHLDED
jgi:hypothetical protein